MRKCVLLQTKVSYLDHTVTIEGVNVQDKNVKPVKNWSEPQKVKDVQSLGPIGNPARWFSILETYNFKIEHREGVIHANAYALSRIPIHRCQKWPDCSKHLRAQVNPIPLNQSTENTERSAN